MIEAAKKLTCIFVECEFGLKNADLSRKYGVRSYPTVLLCDGDGKVLDTLASRDPAGVASHLESFAAGGTAAAPIAGPPPFALLTAKSLDQARAAGKPLAVYFYDDSPASQTLHQSFADPLLKPALEAFHFVRKELARGATDGAPFGVDRAPCVVVLDSAPDVPASKPRARIQGSRSPRELRRELDLALGRPVAEERPAEREAADFVLPRADEFSDDEVDRQFILASISVAKEWVRKGRKQGAVGILEDLVKTYPKHRATLEARKLLEELKK